MRSIRVVLEVGIFLWLVAAAWGESRPLSLSTLYNSADGAGTDLQSITTRVNSCSTCTPVDAVTGQLAVGAFQGPASGTSSFDMKFEPPTLFILGTALIVLATFSRRTLLRRTR